MLLDIRATAIEREKTLGVLDVVSQVDLCRRYLERAPPVRYPDTDAAVRHVRCRRGGTVASRSRRHG